MTDARRPLLVIDMNLSPRWVEALASIGYESIHWSDAGKADARDSDIMSWARVNGRVVFTFDLDFGKMIAIAHAEGPSLLQVRMSEALPRQILPVIRRALDRYGYELIEGAIVTVDDAKTRVRILPF